MEWHDGTERRRFEREQTELRKQYLAAGMTEEQIQALYAFDREWYKSRRREAVHTQRLDIQTSEDEDINKDNPLYKKFFEKLAVEDKHADYSRYGWIDELENEELVKTVNSLSDTDKELLTMLIEGFNQAAIALSLGMTQPAVSQRIKKFEKFFKSAYKIALSFASLLRGINDSSFKGARLKQSKKKIRQKSPRGTPSQAGGM